MCKVDLNAPVAFNVCKDYEYKKVYCIIEKQLSEISDNSLFKGKNIVIKPNLLLKANPEQQITTNPVVLECVAEYLKKQSPASVTIAESPGGPYTPASLKMVYKSAGIEEAAKSSVVELNYDVSFENVSNPNGKVCRSFDIISPILKADVIVNVCKLKTHSLTTMSCATKNLFGTVPGIHKFEMHTRYPDPGLFEEMIIDLCEYHINRVPVISVCDGIFGMEGNGPSGGKPRNFGFLLSSLNTFNLDVVSSTLIGLSGKVRMIEKAKERNLCKKSAKDIEIIGDEIESNIVNDLILPETKSLKILKILPKMFGGKINRFLEPRPVINTKKCIGCATCFKSCPAKTIVMKEKNGKKYAFINDEKCIKCFCCQELCTLKAVNIRKNPIFKIIK